MSLLFSTHQPHKSRWYRDRCPQHRRKLLQPYWLSIDSWMKKQESKLYLSKNPIPPQQIRRENILRATRRNLGKVRDDTKPNKAVAQCRVDISDFNSWDHQTLEVFDKQKWTSWAGGPSCFYSQFGVKFGSARCFEEVHLCLSNTSILRQMWKCYWSCKSAPWSRIW